MYSNKIIKVSISILVLFGFLTISSVITVSNYAFAKNTSADLYKFANNDILFYEPSCAKTNSPCENSFSGTKYNFSNDELKRLYWAAESEQGSNAPIELSAFANVFEAGGGTPGDGAGLIEKVTQRYKNGGSSGWFASTTGEAYETGCSSYPDSYECFNEPSEDQIQKAREILNEGKRAIPAEINEHDQLSDIESISTGDKNNPADYKSGETIITNHYGSTYTFYVWANLSKTCSSEGGCGDPFGYTDTAPQENTTCGSGGSINVYGNTIEEKIWTGLTSFMTDEAAAGTMGNMAQEAGFNPARWQTSIPQSFTFDQMIGTTTGGHGIGLIQWSGGRRPAFLNYVKDNDDSGLDLLSYLKNRSEYDISGGAAFLEKAGDQATNALISIELEYLKYEMDHSRELNLTDYDWSELYNYTDVDQATEYFFSKIEQPGDSTLGYRQQEAHRYYNAYHGNTISNTATTTTNGITTQYSGAATTSNGVSLHSPQNPWLSSAGLDGYEKNAASNINGIYVDDNAMLSDGSYTSFASDAGNGSGLPGFIVLHWTAADNFNGSFTTFCGSQGFYCPPHFTIDVVKKKIYQHFPLSSPSAALAAGSDGTAWDKYAIQIEIVGHGGTKSDSYCMSGACSPEYSVYNFTEDQWEYLAKLLVAISTETGIPLTSSVKWSESMEERTILTPSEMRTYTGVMGHINVDGKSSGGATNAYNKTDPGTIWEYVEKALTRIGHVYGGGTADICGSTSANGNCFKLEEGAGGCTKDNYTYFWQGSGPWSSVPYACETIGAAGCGPSALAMIVTALTGKLVTPDQTAELATKGGYDACMGGSYRGIGKIATEYGLKAEGVTVTEELVNKGLREGKMYLFTVGYTPAVHLTTGGHFIAIRKISSSGKWLLFNSSTGSIAGTETNDYEFNPSDIIEACTIHGSCSEAWEISK